MVNRPRALSETPIAQLIRWIADDDIEFHVEDFLWLVGMNEGVGVTLQLGPSLIALLIRSAVRATPALPGVLHPPEADISFGIIEGLADGILSVGRLGAVYGPPRKQGGQLCDRESVELLLENMV